MSDDLISRKALMVAINTDFYEHFTACHDSDQTALIDMVMQDIEEIPTAYDVDAVLKKIREKEEKSRKDWFKNDDKHYFSKAEAYCESMNIVRNGGKKE